MLWIKNHFLMKQFTEYQAILSGEQVLTINVIFGISGRTNSPNTPFISFHLADVCSKAFWGTWVYYTRKLNLIYIFITICPFITRSCVQPEETEDKSVLKSKHTGWGYSQDVKLATVVDAITGWFQRVTNSAARKDAGLWLPPWTVEVRIIFSINIILSKHRKQTFPAILPSVCEWTCKYLQRFKINWRQKHDSVAHTHSWLWEPYGVICSYAKWHSLAIFSRKVTSSTILLFWGFLLTCNKHPLKKSFSQLQD